MSINRCLAMTSFFASCAVSTTASPATFKTLYNFSSANGPHGAAPVGAILYRHGDIFGVTSSGGLQDQYSGVIYKFNVATQKETTIYQFQDADDGHVPEVGLVNHHGIFYGATAYGVSACGAIYAVDPLGDKFSVVYSFPPCNDGVTSSPYGLTEGGGLLYGVGRTGGANAAGTIFSVDPVTSKETELYSFSGVNGNPDGLYPEGSPLYFKGKLYGTTELGGASHSGTIFSFDLSTNTEKVLYSFAGGNNGSFPTGYQVYYQGSLYGVASCTQSQSKGFVYRYDIAAGTESVFHQFAGKTEGMAPAAGLTLLDGVLYGTTTSGGTGGGGTIFSLNIMTGSFKVLHSFSGSEGSNALTPLLYHQGSFFGTTAAGGQFGQGTIFSIMP